MPTAGEARQHAAKRNRSPENHGPNKKKQCDPKTDAQAPTPKETPFGKCATQKPTVPQPTEAQRM